METQRCLIEVKNNLPLHYSYYATPDIFTDPTKGDGISLNTTHFSIYNRLITFAFASAIHQTEQQKIPQDFKRAKIKHRYLQMTKDNKHFSYLTNKGVVVLHRLRSLLLPFTRSSLSTAEE